MRVYTSQTRANGATPASPLKIGTFTQTSYTTLSSEAPPEKQGLLLEIWSDVPAWACAPRCPPTGAGCEFAACRVRCTLAFIQLQRSQV